MDATREDLVQFISVIRYDLQGVNGLVGEPVQTETLDQLKRQLDRLMRRPRRSPSAELQRP